MSGVLVRRGVAAAARHRATVARGSITGTITRAGTVAGFTPAAGVQTGLVSGTVTRHGTVTGTTPEFTLGSIAGTVTRVGTVAGFRPAVSPAKVGLVSGTLTRSGTVTGMRPTGPGLSGVPLGVPGTSINTDEPSYYTDWRAVRVYRQNGTTGLVATFNKTHPVIIGVTDDPNWPRNGGAANATKVVAMLEEFYYGSGSAARANCWVNVANGNEVTNEYDVPLPANVIDTWRLMYNAVHTLNGNGSRRYPKASMGIDVTTFTITQGTAGPRFKPIAQYCDFVAASLYPAGRKDDPVTFTPYGVYTDSVLAMMIDWRATANPNLNRFAVWETGIPIDHAADSGAPNSGGTTNWTIRPRYFAGGRASNGVTYEGLFNYVWRKFRLENNFEVNELLYWNQQSDPDIPNPFKHDRTPLASPDLVTAVHDWTPGSSLPNL